MINRAIKYRLYPTVQQCELFAQTFGCCQKYRDGIARIYACGHYVRRCLRIIAATSAVVGEAGSSDFYKSE